MRGRKLHAYGYTRVLYRYIKKESPNEGTETVSELHSITWLMST